MKLPVLAGQSSCTKCDFAHSCQSTGIGGRPLRVIGDQKTAILIVGQSPGKQEDAAARVFVGRAGQLLTDSIDGYFSYLPADPHVYATNAIKCCPPYKVDPKIKQVKACGEWLFDDIAKLQAVYDDLYILCVGKAAAQSVLGAKSLKAGLGMQGRIISKLFSDARPLAKPVRVWTTYHPSFLLRDPSSGNIAAVGDHLHRMRDTIEGNTRAEIPSRAATADEFISALESVHLVSIDIETYGIWKHAQQRYFHPALSVLYDNMYSMDLVVSVAVACMTPEGIITWAADMRNPVQCQSVVYILKKCLENNITLLGTNILFDATYLRYVFPFLPWEKVNLEDLCVLSFLENPVRPELSLKDLAPLLLDGVSTKYAAKGTRYDNINDILAYNVQDVVNPLRLRGALWSRCKAEGRVGDWEKANNFYRTEVMPVLFHMSHAGVAMDSTGITRILGDLSRRREKLLKASTQSGLILAGKGSQNSVRDLFEQVVGMATTPTGHTWELTDNGGHISTGKSNMQTAEHSSGLTRDLRRKLKAVKYFRKLDKLAGSYFGPLAKMLYASNNVYPSWFPVPSQFDSNDGGFSQSGGTRQARITCKRPGLQTSPKIVKSMFTSRYGPTGQLFSFDYSQLEVRIAAWESGDPVMMDIYFRGADIHKETQEFITGRTWKDSDPNYDHFRRISKFVVFGSIYGITPPALSDILWKTAGIHLDCCEGCRKHGYCTDCSCFRFLDGFRQKFHRFCEWRDECVEKVRKTGKMILPETGQWRPFSVPTIGEPDKAIFNFPIQAEAANIALVAQRDIIHKLKVVCPLNIYDCVLVDRMGGTTNPNVYLPDARRFAREVSTIMTDNWYLRAIADRTGRSVPIKVDGKLLTPTPAKL